MGIQVNFYLSPSDMVALEARILSIEPALLLPTCSKSESLEEVSAMREGDATGVDIFVYLARRSDLPQVRTQYIERQGYWAIDDSVSPVIQLNRCVHDDMFIRRGRLWCEHRYVVDRSKWVLKDPEFISWSKRVLGVARRALSYLPEVSAYVGPEAATLYAAGRAKLEEPRVVSVRRGG